MRQAVEATRTATSAMIVVVWNRWSSHLISSLDLVSGPCSRNTSFSPGQLTHSEPELHALRYGLCPVQTQDHRGAHVSTVDTLDHSIMTASVAV
jgi:hypothetical protein